MSEAGAPLRFQPLITDRLTVRRMQMNDLDAFVVIRNDPEVGRYQSWRVLDRPAAQAFITAMSQAEPGAPGARSHSRTVVASRGYIIGGYVGYVFKIRRLRDTTTT